MSRHRRTLGRARCSDLKERGMLDDTLVVWGGEFGRTPFGQGDPSNPKGRDHFGKAYSWWLAGGGVKPGAVFGSTDDFAWNITADPVHVHDGQATILHLCGIDLTRLTYRYQGRQYRLTDVSGKVVSWHAGLIRGARLSGRSAVTRPGRSDPRRRLIQEARCSERWPCGSCRSCFCCTSSTSWIG